MTLLGLKNLALLALSATKITLLSMKNPSHGPTSSLATPTTPPLLATTCCNQADLSTPFLLQLLPLDQSDHPPPDLALPTMEATAVLNGQETTTTTTEEPSLHTTTTSPEATLTTDPCTHPLKTGATPSQLAISTIPTLIASKHQFSQLAREQLRLTVTQEDHFFLATTKLSTTLSPNQRFATNLTPPLFATTPSPPGMQKMYHTGTSPTEISMTPV